MKRAQCPPSRLSIAAASVLAAAIAFTLQNRASTNFSEGRLDGGELDHYIGVATTKDHPETLVRLVVPASTWAVFESVGPFPETLQNIWGRIYSEWFPSARYVQAEGPEILWNENKEVDSPAFHSEIWIPVTKRQ